MVAYTDTYYHYSILFNTFQRCETSTKTDLVCLKTYVTCFFLMYVYDLRVCIYIYTYHIYIYIYTSIFVVIVVESWSIGKFSKSFETPDRNDNMDLDRSTNI